MLVLWFLFFRTVAHSHIYPSDQQEAALNPTASFKVGSTLKHISMGKT